MNVVAQEKATAVIALVTNFDTFSRAFYQNLRNGSRYIINV